VGKKEQRAQADIKKRRRLEENKRRAGTRLFNLDALLNSRAYYAYYGLQDRFPHLLRLYLRARANYPARDGEAEREFSFQVLLDFKTFRPRPISVRPWPILLRASFQDPSAFRRTMREVHMAERRPLRTGMFYNSFL
jgi:hypothetical protein